jgi:hypothetical protein
MRILPVLALLLAAGGSAAADDVPLPRPKPVANVQVLPPAPEPIEITDAPPAAPSACRLRLTAELAVAPSLPPTAGPGECGGPDLIRLEAVMLPEKGKVAFNPPAVLRCGMAETVVQWIREDVAPAVGALGSPLKALDIGSYECRNRNRAAGGKLSEHGRANALDLGKLKLANGQTIDLVNPAAAKDLRASIRQSACTRFTTVLGPGADSSHENHVHLDLAERRGGYRMCQWDVREPAPVAAIVPLPPPRPKIDGAGTDDLGKHAAETDGLGKHSAGTDGLGKSSPATDGLGKRAVGTDGFGKRAIHERNARR